MDRYRHSRHKEYDGESRRRHNDHYNDDRRRHKEYYGDDRIKERHKIFERGVESVWGKSPKPHVKEKKDKHRHHKSRSHKIKSKRHSSQSSPSSSSSSKSSSPDPSGEPVIEAHFAPKDVKKKTTSYTELMNKREEEEFILQLKKKQEQSKKDEDAGDSSGPGSSNPLDPKAFGRALLPGEGAAMAHFVAGGKRIPRRGEIGLTSDKIEQFEKQGYVMSGSRHRRMEAVRLRKESQIYSAEEKRALANLDREEKAKKNEKLQSYFTQIIQAKQQSTTFNSNSER